MSTSPAPASRLTVWLIVGVAALGFLFDTYELLMMPVIAGPALAELLDVPVSSELVRAWGGYIFWASAFSGGIFGLFGGYLTDRFGRRRVLVWSILLYAFSASTAAFSTSAPMLLVLRCTTFIGVCVEFVAAVAWLAELFPEPRRREAVLGYTQAFASVGGLAVTLVSKLVVEYAHQLPPLPWIDSHAAWRYTLMSGLLPAIPLIVIRPFLPESPVWREQAARGTLKRPSLAELFRPAYRRATLVSTLLSACSFAAAFGAIQLAPTLIVPGIPEVAALGKEAAVVKPQIAQLERQLKSAHEPIEQARLQLELRPLRAIESRAKQPGNDVQFWQELGGLSGRLLLAYLAVRMVSRRWLLRIFQWPGLVIVPLVFWFPATSDLALMKWGMFAAGLLTVAQFSFWGNYLPRVFPTHLRGTGEGFAANVGGRMLGTSAAFVTTQLARFMPGDVTFHQTAYAAAIVALTAYAAGSILSFFLPEPGEAELPE